MVHLLRALLAGAALIFVFAPSVASAQASQSIVTLPDGRKLAITCVGEGSPTILLDSGLGMPMAVWSKVQPELGKIGRTCAYNRAGYAGSDPGSLPRDAAHVVDDMKMMTTAAGLPGPYLLVGQSLGTHHARLFASRYPGAVAGLVLIDPILEREDLLRAASPVEAKVWDDLAEKMQRCVAARARGETWSEADAAFKICGPAPKLPSPAAEIAMAQATSSEYANRNISGRQVRDDLKTPMRVPMIVLTADGDTRHPDAPVADRAAVQAVHVEQQRLMAATSMRGEQRTVKNGTHLMQWDNPEAVIAAVREVAAAAVR